MKYKENLKKKRFFRLFGSVLLLCMFISTFNSSKINADDIEGSMNDEIQISANIKRNGEVLTAGTTIGSSNSNSNHIVSEYTLSGKSKVGQKLEFEVSSHYQYVGTFMNSFKQLQYEGETIANVTYTNGYRTMTIEFTKEVDFEAFIPARATINKNNSIFDDVPESGIDIQTSYEITGDYTYGPMIVVVKFDPVSTETTFKKSAGLFDPYNRGDNSMLYNISFTTKLTNPDGPAGIKTVHYIADMPQDGTRFNEQSLRVYQELPNGSTGPLLFNSNNSTSNDKFNIYRIFYDLDENGHAETIKEKFPLKGYIDWRTGEDVISNEAAMVPKNYKIIGIDDEIPAEYENQPYGFLLEIKNNTTNKVLISYETIIYNTDKAGNFNGKPRFNNKATYYSQEIPDCFNVDPTTCRPIESETSNQSSFGDVPDGNIVIDVKYGNVNIKKSGVTLQEGQEIKRTLLDGANFSLKTRSGNDVQGKYNSKTIILNNIISEKEIINGSNLYVETPDGRISLSDLRIPTGIYILEESIVPEGYEKDGDKEIRVQEGQINEYEIENYTHVEKELIVTGRVNIKKYGILMEGNNEIDRYLLKGAKFTLKDSNNNVVVGKYDSQLVLLQNLISADKEDKETNIFVVIDEKKVPLSQIDIPVGTYEMEETLVPDKYTKKENLIITILENETKNYELENYMVLNKEKPKDDSNNEDFDKEKPKDDSNNGDFDKEKSKDNSNNRDSNIVKPSVDSNSSGTNSPIVKTGDSTNVVAMLLWGSSAFLGLFCLGKVKKNRKRFCNK